MKFGGTKINETKRRNLQILCLVAVGENDLLQLQYMSANAVTHAVFFCWQEPDDNSQKEVCYLLPRDYKATMEWNENS